MVNVFGPRATHLCTPTTPGLVRQNVRLWFFAVFSILISVPPESGCTAMLVSNLAVLLLVRMITSGQTRSAQQQVQRRRRSPAPEVRLPRGQALGAAAGVRVSREGVQESTTGSPGWP